MIIKLQRKGASFRNKYLALFTLLSFSFTVNAQVYQNDPAYGRSIDRYEVRKDLGIPTVCGEPVINSTVINKAKIAYDSCNHISYIYDPVYKTWQVISANAAVSQQDGLISGGIVTYSGSGLTYYVSSALYRIGGEIYSSPSTSITLDAADATNPRIDLFAVDTTGNAIKITGIAATTPLTPQVNSYQLALTTGITLAPGATVPTGAISTIIYDENTEWTPTTTATVNFDNTVNPYHGTKDALVSNYGRNSTITFTGTSQSVNTESVLRSFIYLNDANYSIQYRFYNGTTAVSNALTLNSSFGFNPGLYNVYQNVSIPLSSFTWSGQTYDKLVITMTGRGGTGTFYLDFISVEGGTTAIPPATDYSNKVDSVSTKKINDSAYVNLNWIKGLAYQKGDTIKISSAVSGTDNTAYHTMTPYPDSVTLNRPNGTKDVIVFPKTKLYVTYPLSFNLVDTSFIFRNDTLPKLTYAPGVDTSGTNAMEIPVKKWVLDRLSGGITQSQLNDTAAAIRAYSYPLVGNPSGFLTSSSITGKLNISDTASMLSPYLKSIDTTFLHGRLVSSFAKNATKDSIILTLNDGSRYAVKDSVGAGGGSTDTTSLSNRINKKQQNLGWVNVMDYGADSTGVADNYTAFTAAQTALGGHGTLFIPKGTYLFTQTFTISSNIIIRGEGMGKNHGNYSVTKITANTNIDLWKITAAGVQITDVGFEYTNATAATFARGLYVYNTDTDVALHQPDLSEKLILRNVSVRAFYKNIYIEKCAYWLFDNVENINPVAVGLHIENTTNQDAGDWSISNSYFFQPMSTPGGIALEQTGSGGGKIVNVKFNGAWNYCIWDSMPNSLILLVSNCSFENFVYEAIHILNTASVKISGCEFAPFKAILGVAIVYLKKSNGGIIANNTFSGGGGGAGNMALKLDSCIKTTSSFNNYNGFTSPTPYLISGGSLNGIIDFNGSHYNANIQGVNYQLDQTLPQFVAYGTTTTFDASLGKSGYVTLTGNTTLTITNFNEGDYLTLVVIQDGTGGRTMTLTGGINVINGGLGTVVLTATSGARDVLCFTKIGGTIYCTIGKNYN